MNFIYYVYAYLRKSTLTPYYIGKGKKGRAWEISHCVKVPRDKSRIVILESNLSEVGAFALERRYIEWYGRKDLGTGILRNMTAGGEGGSGRVVSKETRQKISTSNTGKKRSDEVRNNIRNGLLNSAPFTEERKRNLSIAGKGRVFSDDHKSNISSSLKLYMANNPEVRRKISESKKGKKHTEEAKAKIREAAVRREAAKKQKDLSMVYFASLSTAANS